MIYDESLTFHPLNEVKKETAGEKEEITELPIKKSKSTDEKLKEGEPDI